MIALQGLEGEIKGGTKLLNKALMRDGGGAKSSLGGDNRPGSRSLIGGAWGLVKDHGFYETCRAWEKGGKKKRSPKFSGRTRGSEVGTQLGAGSSAGKLWTTAVNAKSCGNFARVPDGLLEGEGIREETGIFFCKGASLESGKKYTWAGEAVRNVV